MKKLLVLGWLFGLSVSGFAATVVGSDISYRPIFDDSTVYEIRIVIYRNCEGLKLDNISSSTRIRCANGTSSTSLSPTLVSVREVTSYSGRTLGCTPTNTALASPGIEEIIFLDTIDFSQSPFSSYASCNEVSIEYNTCCRASVNNTGAANTIYHSNARLFLGNFKQNESLTFVSHPIHNVPINYPIRYVNRVKEGDGDSISYKLVGPRTSDTTTATFTGSLAADMPVNVFFFGSLTYPYSNPNFSPPIGFYFNSKTGDMVFTPTSANQISSYTIEATEWRKDTSGNYKKAGMVSRDMRLLTQNISDNSFPEFNNLSSLLFSCIGEENSIQIRVTDDRVIPPPPASPPTYDTLDLDLFCDLPVELSVDSQKFANNTSTLYATISWSTDSFETIPNSFDIVLKAYEANRLTAYNYETRRIQVLNYPRPKLTSSLQSIGCGFYEIEVSSDSFQNAAADANILVYNANNQLVYSSFLPSTQRKDTFRLDASGTYYTEILGSFALACSTTIRDTFETTGTNIYPLPNETDILVCYQDSTTLSIDPIWQEGRWGTGDTAHQVVVKQDGIYTVELLDSCNNTFQHSYLVSFRTITPQVEDTAICAGGVANFLVQLPTRATITWPNNATQPDYFTLNPGDYIALITDSLCNESIIDSFSVVGLPLPTVSILGDSTFVCEDSSVLLTAQLQDYDAAIWNTGSDSASTRVTGPGFYSISATNICGIARDTIRVIGKKLPIVNLGSDKVRCKGDSIEISINPDEYTFTWSTGDTTETITIKNEQLVVLAATNFCGTVTDTIGAYFVDTPRVDLGPDIAKDEFALITLRNQTPSRFATYLWSIGSNADSLQVRLAGDYWLQETNACGTDSDTINVRYTVGVEQLENTLFKVYPNPATDKIMVNTYSLKPYTLYVYSPKGEMLLAKEECIGVETIDLSSFSKGVYSIKVTYDGVTTTKNVILN